MCSCEICIYYTDQRMPSERLKTYEELFDEAIVRAEG